MPSPFLVPIITALVQGLPQTISTAIGGTSNAVSTLQSLIVQLETSADNPAMAAQFAHDITVAASGMPMVQVLALKIWQMTQNPATYNPMLVMADCQAMLGQLANQNSGFLGGLAGIFGGMTQTTTWNLPGAATTAGT